MRLVNALLCAAVLVLLGLLESVAYAGTATITWSAPTANTDGSAITGVISYKVFGGKQGASRLQIAAPGNTSFIHRDLVGGDTWCYHVTAVVNGQESIPSNVVCKAIPQVVPNPPVIVTVETVAYEIVKRSDTLALVAVGTVERGIACKAEQSANGFNVVPRNSVKFTATERPLVVVAKCG